jgi:hypothetical protein
MAAGTRSPHVGIDIVAVHGLVPGLLLLVAFVLAYVLIAGKFIRLRGQSIVAPSVFLGAAAFAMAFGGLQLMAIADSGAVLRAPHILATLGSFALPGFAGSWLSCRSLLRSVRGLRSRTRAGLLAFGAFSTGIVITTLVAVVAVVALGQR